MLTVFLITARMVSESSATKILKAIALSPASLNYSISDMRRFPRCPVPRLFHPAQQPVEASGDAFNPAEILRKQAISPDPASDGQDAMCLPNPPKYEKAPGPGRAP
jgi:hypothetical protein